MGPVIGSLIGFWVLGFSYSMVRAAGTTHKGHAEHAIQTVVDVLEALVDERIQIDVAVPPSFEGW